MRNTERPDIQPIMNNEQVMPATLTRRDEQVMKEKFKKSFSQELPGVHSTEAIIHNYTILKEAFGDEVDDVVYMIDDVVKLSQVAGTIQKYNLYEQIAKLDVEIHVKKTQQQMKHALGLLQGGHAVKGMQALQQIDNDYNIQERTLGLAISQGVHPAMLQHIGQEELLQPEYLDTHLENIVQELTVSLRGSFENTLMQGTFLQEIPGTLVGSIVDRIQRNITPERVEHMLLGTLAFMGTELQQEIVKDPKLTQLAGAKPMVKNLIMGFVDPENNPLSSDPLNILDDMGWKKKTELIQQITTLMKPGLEDVQQSLRDQVAPLLELIQREIPFDADHPETMLQEIDAVFAIFDDIGATEACLSGLVAYGETKQLPSGADIDTWETMITSPQEEAAKIHAAFNGSAQMLTALGVPDIVQELEQEGMQKAIAEAMKNPQIDQAFDVMMGLGIEDPDHPIVEFIVMLMNLFKKGLGDAFYDAVDKKFASKKIEKVVEGYEKAEKKTPSDMSGKYGFAQKISDAGAKALGLKINKIKKQDKQGNILKDKDGNDIMEQELLGTGEKNTMQNIVDSIDTKLVARLWYRNFPQGKDTAGKRTQGFVYAEEFESNNEYTSVEDYVMRLTADRLNTTEGLTETSVSLPVVLGGISQNYLDHKHAREDADGLKDERDQVAGVSEEEPDTQSKEGTKEVAGTTSQKTEKPTASKEKKDEAKEGENGVLDDKVGMGEKNG